MGLTPVTADNGVEHGKIEPKFMDKIVAKGLDGKGVRAEGRATDDLESAEDSQNFTRQDRAYEDFVRRESAAMGFRDLLRVGDDNIGREGIGEESAGGNGVGEEPPLTTNVGGIKKPAFESAEDLQRYYTKPNPAGEEYGRDLDFEKLGRDFGGEDGIYDPSNAADVGRLRAYEESYNSAFAEQEQTAINNAGNVPKEYTEEQVIENHGAGLHVGDTITDENGAVRTVTDINADGSHSTDRTDYNIDEQSVTREQWQANEMELNARVKSSAVTIEEMRAEDPSEITVGSAWNKGGRSAYDRAFEQYVRQENAVTGDMREYDLDSAREVDPGIYDVKNTSRGTVDRIAITRNADRSYNATQTHSFAPEQYMSLDGLKTGISALGAQGVLDHGTVLAARDQGLEVVGRYDNDTYVVQDSAGNRSFIDATKGAGPDGAWNYGVRANLGDLRPLSQPEPERTQ
jgi:hypothetical protein